MWIKRSELSTPSPYPPPNLITFSSFSGRGGGGAEKKNKGKCDFGCGTLVSHSNNVISVALKSIMLNATS